MSQRQWLSPSLTLFVDLSFPSSPPSLTLLLEPTQARREKLSTLDRDEDFTLEGIKKVQWQAGESNAETSAEVEDKNES
jgi:hypothetical protein